MDYLAKSDAPFSDELWSSIGSAVVGAAKESLVGRRFLPLYGPVGPGAAQTFVQGASRKEVMADGIAYFEGRSPIQIPQLYEDFWLYWRELAQAEHDGMPQDLSAARTAGVNLAFREDEMIFYGLKALGIEGLTNAKGIKTKKRSDWTKGEGAFTDVSAAISDLYAAKKIGRHTVVLSEDLFVQLQRIQPGTGVLESVRVENLVDGRLFRSPVLQPGTALVFSALPQYMDLFVGQDVAVAYTEAVDLNHHLRALETALPRVKDAGAIIALK